MEFMADHEEGRLFCRTLYPENAALTKVGGPGKEFWANGKNWELAPETAEFASNRYNGALFGNWRIEVSPGTASREDIFVHVIQTGDTSLARMDAASLVEEDGMIGARIITPDNIVKVTFATDGEPAGHVAISSGVNLFVDRDLATTVQPQSGLAGN